ncbi:four helix bundle protein [Patescibacteria group bacterium]|nr:four helix bundle protein [Patescibacteria group bacterium]
MPNQIQNLNYKSKYDLEERTAKFGEDVIEFLFSLQKNDINRILINQTVRSGTSVGANYCEADGAESKKDFNHKIGICKKEAKETMHWLRMIAKANPDRAKECRILWQETHEFALIFSAIINKSKS